MKIACISKKVIRSTLLGKEIRLEVGMARIAIGYQVNRLSKHSRSFKLDYFVIPITTTRLYGRDNTNASFKDSYDRALGRKVWPPSKQSTFQRAYSRKHCVFVRLLSSGSDSYPSSSARSLCQRCQIEIAKSRCGSTLTACGTLRVSRGANCNCHSVASR